MKKNILTFIVLLKVGFLFSLEKPSTIRFKRFLATDTSYFNGNYRASLINALAEPNLFIHDSDYYKFTKLKATDYSFVIWNLEQTARAYSALNICDSAIYYINKLISIKGCDIGFFTKQEYAALKGCQSWNNIYDSCMIAYFEDNKINNREYYLELSRIANNNWYYRRCAATFFDYLPMSYIELLDKKQILLDSIGNIKLDSLIIKYGFPDNSNTGNYGAEIAFNIIHHSGTEMILKYQKDIEIIYKKGLIGSESYAKYVDRILVNTNCPQRYGTQYWYDDIDKKNYIFPVEDEYKINELRKKMSLIPIEDFCKSKLKSESVIYKNK